LAKITTYHQFTTKAISRNDARQFINVSNFSIEQRVKDSFSYVARRPMLDVWLRTVEFVHVITFFLLLLLAQVSLEHLKCMVHHLKIKKSDSSTEIHNRNVFVCF